MMTAMNIGKIAMGTIHASSSRDMVNRLEHTPMKVPLDIIPVIDVLIVVSIIRAGQGKAPVRKMTQVSEISGIETNVLLSDLYKFDYTINEGLPNTTQRNIQGHASQAFRSRTDRYTSEEVMRATILQRLNEKGLRDIQA